MCVILHMSVTTQWGLSALMWAAMGGETEAVVELVNAGANVDMQDEVCQYIYVVHDVNVQSHTSTLNSLLYIITCMCVHVLDMGICTTTVHLYVYGLAVMATECSIVFLAKTTHVSQGRN